MNYLFSVTEKYRALICYTTLAYAGKRRTPPPTPKEIEKLKEKGSRRIIWIKNGKIKKRVKRDEKKKKVE